MEARCHKFMISMPFIAGKVNLNDFIKTARPLRCKAAIFLFLFYGSETSR